MASCYELSCPCGWKVHFWLGGKAFRRDAYSDVEDEVQKEQHPDVTKLWEELLLHPLLQAEKERPDRKTLFVPSFLRSRTGKEVNISSRPYVYSGWVIGSCTSCCTVDSYLQVVTARTEQQEILHPTLCKSCGGDIQKLAVEMVHCPRCSTPASHRRMAIE